MAGRTVPAGRLEPCFQGCPFTAPEILAVKIKHKKGGKHPQIKDK
jgi:hypothetical protein